MMHDHESNEQQQPGSTAVNVLGRLLTPMAVFLGTEAMVRDAGLNAPVAALLGAVSGTATAIAIARE